MKPFEELDEIELEGENERQNDEELRKAVRTAPILLQKSSSHRPAQRHLDFNIDEEDEN